MDIFREDQKHIMDWDESDVQNWLSGLGFPQYEQQIREHKIQGDSLCLLDSEGLKSLGITTVGQRLLILKLLYRLKLAHEIPLTEQDYIPPSETLPPAEDISLDYIHSTVKDQGIRLRTLEESNRTLNLALRSFSDEIIKLRSSMGLSNDLSTEIGKKLPYLRSDVQVVDQLTERNARVRQSLVFSSSESQTAASTLLTPNTGQESSDSSISTKVTLDDPTWKVLPAALKKHHINTDEWQNYAMFISYGPPGNRSKRRLELDEKPIFLFKQLKEENKNPAFVLKNMKDLSSPHKLDDNTPERQSSSETPAPYQLQNPVHTTPSLSRSIPGF